MISLSPTTRRIYLLMGFLTLTVLLAILSSRSLNLEEFYRYQGNLKQYYSNHPGWTLSVFFLIYVFCAGLAIPGATILTLAAGSLFGFWKGLVVVSLASSFGATVAFLLARVLFRNWIQATFSRYLIKINEGIKNEGAFYLFALRVVPTFPFFVVNSVMGLTAISVFTFYWVSLVGMLPGTVVYINAGAQLSQVTQLHDLFSTKLLLSLSLLGILPLLIRLSLKVVKKDKKNPRNF